MNFIYYLILLGVTALSVCTKTISYDTGYISMTMLYIGAMIVNRLDDIKKILKDKP